MRVGGNCPLRNPEIARTEHRDLPLRPRLGLEPVEGRKPITRLVAEGVERAAGSKGAAATLDNHLVSALGEEACGKRVDPAPSVRAAHQDDRFGAVVPGAVPIGQERDAVRHGDRDVPADGDRTGARWRQVRDALKDAGEEAHPQAVTSSMPQAIALPI